MSTDNTIKLPSNTAKRISELTDDMLSKTVGNKAHVNTYLETLLDSSRLITTNDVLSGLEGGFSDHIDWDATELKTTAHHPSNATGRGVTGRAAVIRAQSRVGRGVPVPVLLPHSCIWVTLLPPGEAAILALWTSMINDKISLGRYTYGTIFSAVSIVTMQRMIDFVLSRVEATTVNFKDSQLTLKDIILVEDIPFLLNGCGLTMYPRGIEYSSPCVADPSSCSHITTGTLNVETLAWYNSAAIPDSVKVVQASITPGSVSVENVLLCQSTLLKTRKVVLTDETGVPTDVYFKIPSINRAISFGSQWITQVHDSVISALGLEQPNVSDDTWSERNLLITTQGKASFLRQYAAFVTKIDLYEGGVIEDNEQDIADVLTVMSGSDKVRSDMMAATEKFIADSSIGVIGLPVYACPACGKTPDLGGNHILALDPVRLFFKYLVIRVDQINQRSML